MSITFQSKKLVAIGEAMIELALVGENTYRRSFAGDTFNTAWLMSQMSEIELEVGFLTNVGTDTSSDAFVDELAQDGLDVSVIGREPSRTMGLYMIDLEETERSFQYWREQSAARLLADDVTMLDTPLACAGLIHISGITIAILTQEARNRLRDALARARAAGSIVSFDPNVRPQLWSFADEIRENMLQFYAVSDIALPSFEDEKHLWQDSKPANTVARMRKAGLQEIIVTNGASPVTVWSDSRLSSWETPAVDGILDTTGAGDSFNAGYLATRLMGYGPSSAVASGQKMSAEVIRHFGARLAKRQVPGLISRNSAEWIRS